MSDRGGRRSAAESAESTPRYLQIKQAVLEQIRSGVWRPGDPVPGDAEVARRFGCARMTAHRALRELADEGVIERRRRAGSRVALRTTRSLLVDVPRIDLEIEATGAEYGYRLLARSPGRTTHSARARLRLGPDGRTLWLLCLHLADQRPYQLEERWIDLAAAPAAEHESFRDIGPNRWLLEHVPFVGAEHLIRAEAASRRAARHLEVEPGAPLLVLERRTFREQRVVTWVRLAHPGARYVLRTASGEHG